VDRDLILEAKQKPQTPFASGVFVSDQARLRILKMRRRT
jgi:hypothetical protein